MLDLVAVPNRTCLHAAHQLFKPNIPNAQQRLGQMAYILREQFLWQLASRKTTDRRVKKRTSRT
jgi:hypothetical protein